MGKFTVTEVDKGINKEAPSDSVVWADGRNVRFKRGKVYKTPGIETKLMSTEGLRPQAIFTYMNASKEIFVLVCNKQSVWASNLIAPTAKINGSLRFGIRDGRTVTDLADNALWSFMMIGGLPVLSNGLNTPYKIVPGSSTMATLSNAPTFKTGMTHLQRALVGNVTVNSVNWPARIMWSGIANPEDWTVGMGSEAGYRDLIDPYTGRVAAEIIYRMVNVEDTPYIFTDRNIWTVIPARQPAIYTEKILYHGIQLVTPKALTVPGLAENDKRCYFMTTTSFYSLGPDGIKELPRDIRDYAFSSINLAAAANIFAFKKQGTDEVWFCVPTGDNTFPDTAFVYNEERNNWTICDCGDIATYGGEFTLDICGSPDGIVRFMDTGTTTIYGSPIDAYIETGDICITDNGNMLEEVNKYINTVIPLMTQDSTSSGVLYIQVGTKKRLDDKELQWSKASEYKIGYSHKADFRVCAPGWFRIRYRTWQKNSPFSLRGYQVDYTLGGKKR